jgi:anti-anti-sigma factor
MACRIHSDRNGQFRVLRLEGSDFSPSQQAEFRGTVQISLELDAKSPFAIVTTQLDLVGSCCLASIIEAAMSCHKLGTPVVLVEDRALVLEVFEVVSLRSILPIHPSLEQARESLEG